MHHVPCHFLTLQHASALVNAIYTELLTVFFATHKNDASTLCVSVYTVVLDGVFYIVYCTILMCLPSTVSLQCVYSYSQVMGVYYFDVIHRTSSCFAHHHVLHHFLFTRNECAHSVS